MALQLALTTLESVAVLLNERKRDSEQAAAFHVNIEMLRPLRSLVLFPCRPSSGVPAVSWVRVRLAGSC